MRAERQAVKLKVQAAAERGGYKLVQPRNGAGRRRLHSDSCFATASSPMCPRSKT